MSEPRIAPPAAPQFRAHFDAHVAFANGGGLTAEGFRIDLPRPDVEAAEVGRLFVQHLGLALVGSIEVTNLVVVEEQHRGTRGIETTAAAASGRRVVDLSHVIREGLVTYPGLPAPVFTPQGKAARMSSGASGGTRIVLRAVASVWLANEDCWKNEPWTRSPPRLKLADVPSARKPLCFSFEALVQYVSKPLRQSGHAPHDGFAMMT